MLYARLVKLVLKGRCFQYSKEKVMLEATSFGVEQR
jgi:hypothetical protein